jgi:hypothetical protein
MQAALVTLTVEVGSRLASIGVLETFILGGVLYASAVRVARNWKDARTTRARWGLGFVLVAGLSVLCWSVARLLG